VAAQRSGQVGAPKRSLKNFDRSRVNCIEFSDVVMCGMYIFFDDLFVLLSAIRFSRRRGESAPLCPGRHETPLRHLPWKCYIVHVFDHFITVDC
jgi:hypothetical protein